jgi:uncharacterized protein YkwD
MVPPARLVELCDMRARSLLSVLALLLPLPAGAQTGVRTDEVRPELLRLINQERAKAGAPPMRLSAPLGRAAEEHAREIAGSGSFRLPSGAEKAMLARLERVGYDVHEWAEYVASTSAGLPELVRDWQRESADSFRQLMDPAFVDLGVGVSRLNGMPLYTVLSAVPQGEHFARATAGLEDLERVRAAMLKEVNAVRRREGLRPVAPAPLLDQAAQRHAQDMLARSYFAHQSPSGTTVRERAKGHGYDWRAIGENIAEGQTSVAEVMETWMNSPGHRQNILSPKFTELGVGLVMGRSGKNGAYRVLWVQNFGTPR